MRILIALALVTLAPAEQRFGKRITILVDTSGSCIEHYDDIAEAASAVVGMAASDDVEVRARSFASESKVSEWWPGPDAVAELPAWVEAQRPELRSSTHLAPALAAALAEGDVVIVSDGVTFDPGGTAALVAIVVASKRTVATIHVGDRRGRARMRALAVAGKGGAYSWEGK